MFLLPVGMEDELFILDDVEEALDSPPELDFPSVELASLS
jgi:hypothetical protein